MSPESLTAALKDDASKLGFELAGACPAVSPPGIGRLTEWLAAGYAGEMRFLSDRAKAYEHPGHVLDGARSILMLGLAYRTAEPAPIGPGHGRVSRYAWGDDYHDVIHAKLRTLANLHRRLAPGAGVRGVVDTAPLLEREFGRMAGLGWIGKNTLLLNREHGSWFFLAALLSTEVLDYDAPHVDEHCGKCRACLDACPTRALIAPYVLDARRCISYLTIELRDHIPPELREDLDNWLFGCDACQEACPWNSHSATRGNACFTPDAKRNPVDLIELFSLDEASFRERFHTTPLWRSKRRGLLRTAAILLGNAPHEPAIPALIAGLGDAEPPVRAACTWALERYSSPAAAAALRASS